MKISKLILRPNHIHLYAFAIIIVLLGERNFFFYLLVIPFYAQIKRINISKYVFILMMLFAIYLKSYDSFNRTTPQNGEFTVIDKKENTYGSTYIIKHKNIKAKLESNNRSYKVGDVILVTGEFVLINTPVTPRGFDYAQFMKSKGIYHQIKTNGIQLQPYKPSVYTFNQKMREYINHLNVDNDDIFNSLILAINDFDTSFSNDVSSIGVSHLFSVSGLHISLFAIALQSILFMFNKKIKNKIIGILLSIYFVVTLFKTSIFRAVFCYVFNSAKTSFSSLDILSICFIITQFYNPLYTYQVGYVFSYLLVFTFIISNEQTGFKQLFLKSLLAQIVILPLIISINQQINLISILVNPLLIVMFSYFVLPLVFIGLIPVLAKTVDFYVSGFKEIISFFAGKGFIIEFNTFNHLNGFLYYIFIIFIFFSKDFMTITKRTLIGLCLIVIFNLSYYVSFTGQVVFLDVGQGDSSVIIRPFNKCIIVVDAFNTIEEYLIKHNIKAIDYLIITHGDFDHYQKADWILTNLRVGKLVLSKADNSDFKVGHQYNSQTILVESGDKINCGDIVLDILAPIGISNDPNNASVVFKTKIDQLTYLFTGDIETETEQLLVKKYKNELKSDVLKVPHHGSNTSSTKAFVDLVDPTYVVISAGFNNKFSHPHQIIVERYQNERRFIYVTAVDKTICFKYDWINRKTRIKLYKK